jgi:hypothetical protein
MTSSRLTMIAAVAACFASNAGATTVIQSGNATTLSKTLPDANDLWVVAKDIPKINGFELKPEGMCRDDICIPLRQEEDSDLFRRGRAINGSASRNSHAT